MFTGFRNAVESLAQPPRRSESIDETTKQDGGTPRHSASSPSGMGPSTSGSSNGAWPLAGASLPSISNLSKLPFAARSASPARSAIGNARVASPALSESGTRQRLTLEDRLKARFAIGEASPGDTPDPSQHNTPLPENKTLSPASTPLPSSPIVSPSNAATPALTVQIKPLTQETEPEPELPTPTTSSSTFDTAEEDAQSVAATETSRRSFEDNTSEINAEITPETDTTSAVESDNQLDDTQPEALLSPTITSLIAADDAEASPRPRPPSSTMTPRDAEVQPEIVRPEQTEAVTVLSESLPTPTLESSSSRPIEQTTLPEQTKSDSTLLGPDVDSESVESMSVADDGAEATVESLREQLKLVEQRFADVTTSYKKLQADKHAADKIVKEFTALETVDDTHALKDYFETMNLKAEMSQDEIKRLNGKLNRQDERLQELRDIHQLENKSQSELIAKLRQEAQDSSSNSQVSSDALAKAQEEAAKHEKEAAQLRTEVQKATRQAKEEEEKGKKAISLLKTLRQKLVKTEKERDDAVKDAGAGQQKVQEELDKEKAEKAKVQAEVDRVNTERDNALAGMKSHFDREIVGIKERHQKELAAIKGQFELDAVAAKANFSKELAMKDSRIATLEKSVQNLSAEKGHLFEQLQMRQAEYESSQTQLESMQGQTTELNYQLREATERIALLTDELTDARRQQHTHSASNSHQADDAARILALTEAKYEAKLTELRNRMQAAERDRNDGETVWIRKFEDQSREVEELRRKIDASNNVEERHSTALNQIKTENERLQSELRRQREQMASLELQTEQAIESQSTATDALDLAKAKSTALEKQVEELTTREATLKTNVKTLREELRKVQSSVALFERQRAPGVGYFSANRTTSTNEVNGRTSVSSDLNSVAAGSPRSDAPSLPSTNEEALNVEYLRNVILQFLEHKEMRPNLVRVLSAILGFTPQETRRLIAKV